MRTALDSSVLIQLYRKQPGWQEWRDSLQAAAGKGELIISPVASASIPLPIPPWIRLGLISIDLTFYMIRYCPNPPIWLGRFSSGTDSKREDHANT